MRISRRLHGLRCEQVDDLARLSVADDDAPAAALDRPRQPTRQAPVEPVRRAEEAQAADAVRHRDLVGGLLETVLDAHLAVVDLGQEVADRELPLLEVEDILSLAHPYGFSKL